MVSFFLRPRFLLFCLYCMAYVALRGSGEILHQAAETRSFDGVGVRHIVGANSEIPRWRRQAYRVVFPLLMVAEEEGRRLAGGGADWAEREADEGIDLLE